jgi:hypothetical protein
MTLTGTRPSLRPRPVRPRVTAMLVLIFNLLALNAAFLIVSLPLVTLPIAINAVWTALDRWRADGEDRVVREFFSAVRSSPAARVTLLSGVPLVMTAVALEEVHYFARGGDVVARACFGLGLASLVVALTGIGHVFAFVARHPSAPPGQMWSLCARLAVRNLLFTGPLFLVEVAIAAVMALADPALLVIGLPTVLLYLMRLTANWGLRRAVLPKKSASK